MAFNEKMPEAVADEVSALVVKIANTGSYTVYSECMYRLEALALQEDVNGRFEACGGILQTMRDMKARYRDDLLAAREATSPYSKANWATLTDEQKAGRAPMPDFSATERHEAA